MVPLVILTICMWLVVGSVTVVMIVFAENAESRRQLFLQFNLVVAMTFIVALFICGAETGRAPEDGLLLAGLGAAALLVAWVAAWTWPYFARGAIWIWRYVTRDRGE